MTELALTRSRGRLRLDHREGDFAVRVVERGEDRVRAMLVGRRALLLAGDEVRLSVRVGAGVRLELGEVAGTTAYNVRGGARADWLVRIEVAEGGALDWRALPLVVAHGARVRRSTSAELAAGAVLRLRESLVLGRAGERGGELETRLRADLAGEPLYAEDLDLRPGPREEFGVLGGRRVVDSLLTLGERAEPAPAGLEVYQLDGPGTLWRWHGDELHRSPLERCQDRG